MRKENKLYEEKKNFLKEKVEQHEKSEAEIIDRLKGAEARQVEIGYIMEEAVAARDMKKFDKLKKEYNDLAVELEFVRKMLPYKDLKQELTREECKVHDVEIMAEIERLKKEIDKNIYEALTPILETAAEYLIQIKELQMARQEIDGILSDEITWTYHQPFSPLLSILAAVGMSPAYRSAEKKYGNGAEWLAEEYEELTKQRQEYLNITPRAGAGLVEKDFSDHVITFKREGYMDYYKDFYK